LLLGVALLCALPLSKSSLIFSRHVEIMHVFSTGLTPVAEKGLKNKNISHFA
jgi:hypothetical protein